MPLPNPEIWGAPETWLDQNVMYTNNMNNELYKFDSIFDFEPDNGYKIHIGDNRVKKIYIGSKLVDMAYLGDCTLK